MYTIASETSRRHGVKRKLDALLVHRRLPLALGVLSALLTLPSLDVGWVGDDLWHRAVLKKTPGVAGLGILPSGSIMELFRFLDGDPQRTRRLMDIGVLPWWTDPGIYGAFMRPITGVTHWLDYSLWPDRAALMHLHSVLWLSGLVLAVALLYRGMMGVTPAAGLAALAFAMDDAHGMPVGFLANRNALIAAVFGVLALIVHRRWRRDGWRWGAVAGPLLLAASLFSAEAGVGILGYLIAYAVFMDRGQWRSRVLVLAPYAAVVAAWRLTWRGLGYGISPTMEFYVDPLVEPVRFLWCVIERAPILMWGQWLTLSDVSLLIPRPWLWLFWGLALVFLAWIALRIIPLVRREPTARFWALGMLLALPPACATIPNDRMLLYVSLGAFALLGTMLTGVYESSDLGAQARPRSPGRVLRGLLIVVHLAIAPLALAARAANPVGPRGLMERLQHIVPTGAAVEGRDVIVVNPPMAMSVGFVLILRSEAGEPMPRRIRVLGPSLQVLELTRLDQHTLSVRPEYGYLANAFDQIFRGRRRPLGLGGRVELTGITVEVTALTAEGRPAEAVFRFVTPLEDPSWLWVIWKDGAYRSFTPPAVGTTIVIPSAIF